MKGGLFRSKPRTPPEVVQHVVELVTYILDHKQQEGSGGGGKRDTKLEHRVTHAFPGGIGTYLIVIFYFPGKFTSVYSASSRAATVSKNPYALESLTNEKDLSTIFSSAHAIHITSLLNWTCIGLILS